MEKLTCRPNGFWGHLECLFEAGCGLWSAGSTGSPMGILCPFPFSTQPPPSYTRTHEHVACAWSI